MAGKKVWWSITATHGPSGAYLEASVKANSVQSAVSEFKLKVPGATSFAVSSVLELKG